MIMSNSANRLAYTADLNKTIKRTYLDTLFATMDRNAHRFEITVLRGGAAVDLTGYETKGYFVRLKDNALHPVDGTIEDGKAVVVLDRACYAQAGQFSLAIKIIKGEEKKTVFFGEGGMTLSETDNAFTEEYVVVDVAAVLEMIEEAESATSAANTAASNANTKAAAADTAAKKIDGMTVSAVKADAAAAAISEVNGVKHITFSLPKGDKGDQGPKGADGNVAFEELTEEQLEMLRTPSFYVMPQNYGAVGDGVTDDTAAFNTMIDDAVNNGKKIFVPYGRYKVGALLNSDVFDSKADKTLHIEGAGQGSIIIADSFSLAGRIHPCFSNIQFHLMGAGFIMGDASTYVNRGTFRNVYFYGSPTVMTFTFANSLRFYDCRFASFPEYGDFTEPNPVLKFANATTPVNNIAFFGCHFEQTKTHGYFLYKDTTRLLYNMAFYGCHFETRNLGSSFYYLNTVDDLKFDCCAFIANAYTDGGVTDEKAQIFSYLKGCYSVCFDTCLFDYYKTAGAYLMDALACNKLKLDGRVTGYTDVAAPTIDNIISKKTGSLQSSWSVNCYISSTKIITL